MKNNNNGNKRRCLVMILFMALIISAITISTPGHVRKIVQDSAISRKSDDLEIGAEVTVSLPQSEMQIAINILRGRPIRWHLTTNVTNLDGLHHIIYIQDMATCGMQYVPDSLCVNGEIYRPDPNYVDEKLHTAYDLTMSSDRVKDGYEDEWAASNTVILGFLDSERPNMELEHDIELAYSSEASRIVLTQYICGDYWTETYFPIIGRAWAVLVCAQYAILAVLWLLFFAALYIYCRIVRLELRLRHG